MDDETMERMETKEKHGQSACLHAIILIRSSLYAAPPLVATGVFYTHFIRRLDLVRKKLSVTFLYRQLYISVV